MKYLYILWIAIIGLERVDFFGGRGDFVLTPFIAISPLLILLQIILRKQPVKIDKLTFKYLIFTNFFLATVVLSIFFGLEMEYSFKKFILLAFQVYSSIIVIILMRDRKDMPEILIQGAKLGIILSAVFCIAQIMNWFSLIDSSGFVNLEANRYGIFAFRLSGVSLDQNRGAILLVFYLFLLDFFNTKCRLLRTLAIGMIVLSFSRSAILSFFIYSIYFYVIKHKISFSFVKKSLGFLSIIVLVAVFSINVLQRADVQIDQLIAERTDFGTAHSGGIHIALIDRGLEVSASNLSNLIFGVGLGNSYLVLKDFYGDNKYGNFHSTYIGFLVETGVFSLLLFLAMLLLPLLKKDVNSAFIFCLAFFNFLYQLTVEPMLWLSITMIWLYTSNTKFNYHLSSNSSLQDKNLQLS
jgi:hypothetical protein